MLVEDQIQGFKVNIKAEKKSKLSSVVLKIRGIDQVACLVIPVSFCTVSIRTGYYLSLTPHVFYPILCYSLFQYRRVMSDSLS